MITTAYRDAHSRLAIRSTLLSLADGAVRASARERMAGSFSPALTAKTTSISPFARYFPFLVKLLCS